jgi:glycosyltransferase involved in cell wall biosynthesis
VDDGSRDGSGALADRLAEELGGVRVVRHPVNRGYGAALATGFAKCHGRIIAYTDADLPVSPRRFIEVLPELDSADLVIGYPVQLPGGVRRRLYTRGYIALIRLLFGLRVRNINFSFKLVRRSLMERITLETTSGFVDAQLVIQAVRLGARIVEVPVDYQERTAGQSHFDSPLAFVPTTEAALRFWLSSR